MKTIPAIQYYVPLTVVKVKPNLSIYASDNEKLHVGKTFLVKYVQIEYYDAISTDEPSNNFSVQYKLMDKNYKEVKGIYYLDMTFRHDSLEEDE